MIRIKSNEKQIQDAVLKYLSLRYNNKEDTMFWRNNTGGAKTEGGGFIRFGALGSPDIFVVSKGQIIGLEIKDKAKVSDAQKEFAKKFTDAGGIYLVIRSVDDIMKIL